MSGRLTRNRNKCLAAIVLLCLIGVAATLTRAWESALGVARSPEFAETFFDGPISFEPNQGQADDAVKFVARGPGYVLYLTPRGTLLSTRQDPQVGHNPLTGSIGINLVGTLAGAQLVALEPLQTKSSYFIGPDKTKWITGIPNFAEVQFQNIHPGIHVVCHGKHGSLQYDFTVDPGAAPGAIAMNIEGAHTVRLTSDGDLTIRTRQAELRLKKPVAYQGLGHSKHLISARYVIHKRRVTFALGPYDRSKALTIDPVLSYVNYLR